MSLGLQDLSGHEQRPPDGVEDEEEDGVHRPPEVVYLKLAVGHERVQVDVGVDRDLLVEEQQVEVAPLPRLDADWRPLALLVDVLEAQLHLLFDVDVPVVQEEGVRQLHDAAEDVRDHHHRPDVRRLVTSEKNWREK